MDGTMNAPRVPLQLSRGCVVASIQVELSDDVLAQFRSDLLGMVQASAATGVILDVSGIAIMDLEEFRALCDTMNMAALMGARTVFAGFQPGVVSALVELDAPTEDIVAAFNLDAAFALLETEPDIGPDAAEELPPDAEETELEP
jgi:rsbT antagonist protein RsbS